MLDIVFLSFNHCHTVGESLKSVIQSSNGLVGHIYIVDDCSTDCSMAVIESVLAEVMVDCQISVVKNRINLGMAGALEVGLSCSSADFIAICHHDDIYKREYFLGAGLMNNDSAKPISFVFHNYGNGFNWSKEFDQDGLMIGARFFNRFLIRKLNCPVRGSAIINRAAYLEVGGICLEYGLLADVDLWMRLARLSNFYVGYQKDFSVVLREERPEDYPNEYKASVFSVKRLLILYKIHLDNSSGFGLMLSHFVVFIDVVKWVMYFTIRRRKRGSLELSLSGMSLHDWSCLRMYYTIFRWLS